MDEKITNQSLIMGDEMEMTLRPRHLDEYVGQELLKSNLNIYITAAKMREESLDHVLLYGPPGLGKTTLAYIIANEMNSKIKVTNGPSLVRPGDLAAVLSVLEEGDVLFIDEIHRLPKVVEEVLYAAMEDYAIDIIIGKDSTASSIRIDLPPFTLVGATTRFGDLTAPLRDRFGIVEQLNYYNVNELIQIVNRTALLLGLPLDDIAKAELAKRSRGTPRIANRLYRRIRDFAQLENEKSISFVTTQYGLSKMKIDELGLDPTDHRYLKILIENYKGGPVGLGTLAATIGEEVVTLEDVNEPYLLQEGFIERTSRGRVATTKAYEHLNIKREGMF